MNSFSACLFFIPLLVRCENISILHDFRTVTPSGHYCMLPEILGNEDIMRQSFIPKKIMQTWKTHKLPNPFDEWAKSWQEKHPTWNYVLMDDHDNRLYIEKYFPWFLTIYDSFPQEIYRADAIRYFYLYNEGGVYADLDFECLKSIDPLIETGGVIIGKMTEAKIDGTYPNAFMASPPKASFWPIVIYCITQNLKNQRPEHVTGPAIIWQALEIYKNHEIKNQVINFMKSFMPDMVDIPIIIRPKCELYPLDWHSRIYLKTPCSYAVTWWTASWKESCHLGFEKNP